MLTTILGLAVTILTLGGFTWASNRGIRRELGARIDAVASRCETLDGRIGKLDTSNHAIGARIEKLAADIGNLDTRIGNLDAKIDGVNDTLSAKIDGVAKELVELRITVAATFAQHDARLSALESGRRQLVTPT